MGLDDRRKATANDGYRGILDAAAPPSLFDRTTTQQPVGVSQTTTTQQPPSSPPTSIQEAKKPSGRGRLLAGWGAGAAICDALGLKNVKRLALDVDVRGVPIVTVEYYLTGEDLGPLARALGEHRPAMTRSED